MQPTRLVDHQIEMPSVSTSILAADNEGTGTEFLWGFLIGLLLGFFMLLMVSCWGFLGKKSRYIADLFILFSY